MEFIFSRVCFSFTCNLMYFRYILDYKWFEAWKDSVNYNGLTSATRVPTPGPIDNGELLTETGIFMLLPSTFPNICLFIFVSNEHQYNFHVDLLISLTGGSV